MINMAAPIGNVEIRNLPNKVMTEPLIIPRSYDQENYTYRRHL